MRCITTARSLEAQMTLDDVPIGEMKYSFKAYVQVCGFAGDLIITSTTASDLVKSLLLLQQLGIQPMTATGQINGIPVCPVHQRPMKPSRKAGSFYCSAQVGDGYCQEVAQQ